jgi:hypothetical protein
MKIFRSVKYRASSPVVISSATVMTSGFITSLTDLALFIALLQRRCRLDW